MNNKQSLNMLEIGKVPPQAVEVEEAVLGALMLEKNAIEDVISILNPNCFYKEQHNKIFSIILKLYNDSKPIDILTVTQSLMETNELMDVGGPAYLTNLTDRIASGAHIQFHAQIVQQKFIKREMIRIATEISNRGFDDSVDIADLIDYSQTEINKLATGSVKRMGDYIGEIGKKRLKQLEELSKKEVKITGVQSFEKFNNITGGFQPGNMIILAARPGQGKTRIAQELAKRGSLDKPVAIFSLEMEDIELYDRELSNTSGIENMFIRQADFSPEDWKKLDSAQAVIESQKIIIDDTPALTVSEFKAKARLYKKKYDIGMIVIDYLQLMKSPEYKKFREQEISDISRNIKTTAKELKLPIIVLSQLSRDIEKRPDKRPKLSDLRESGAIEQDADVVMFIFREEEYVNIEENEHLRNLIEVIFAKNRHGATGSVKLWKTDNWTTIYESKNDESTDLPY